MTHRLETYFDRFDAVGAPGPSGNLNGLADSKMRVRSWVNDDRLGRGIPHRSDPAIHVVVVESRYERSVGTTVRKSHPGEPLDGIRGVEGGGHQTRGKTIFDRERLAVYFICDEDIARRDA
jgi:hypothetical protein